MLLKCLSIQQPLADMILSGRKQVENRSWTRMKYRDWLKEGAVLLGIHASRAPAKLTEEQRDDYCPGWREGVKFEVGSVLGVVDLLCICRPKDLPPQLREHKFANDHPTNWCWVLSNPRMLVRPFPVAGNGRLFNVDVPDELLSPGVAAGDGSS